MYYVCIPTAPRDNNISSLAQIKRFLLAGAHCCTILTMPLKVVGLEGGATTFPPPLSVADEHGKNADKKSGRKRNDVGGVFFQIVE